MEFYNFAVSSMKLKSIWFKDENVNVYKQMGKEEGLNLYLQLFRFRIHQGDFNQHIFRTSLLELQQFTRINKRGVLSLRELKGMLLQMEKIGVIKIRSQNIEHMIGNEMLIIEAIDVPHLERINDKDEVIDESFYIPVKFEFIDYMYDVLTFTAKEVAFFVLLSMYGMRKGNAVINMKINNMKTRLGTRNEKITNMLVEFNKYGLLYTHVIREGKKTKFEHYMCKSVEGIEKFKSESKKYREKFIQRYENR